MQKKLCLGLGVTLLGVAVLLFVARSTSESDLRPVGVSEAVTVLGGGEIGASYRDGECTKTGAVGCNGKSGMVPNGGECGQFGTGFVDCGSDSCGQLRKVRDKKE